MGFCGGRVLEWMVTVEQVPLVVYVLIIWIVKVIFMDNERV